MDIDEALAVLAALVGSAGHPEGDPALFVVRRELDAARARVAEMEAENKRLRKVASTSVDAMRSDPGVQVPFDDEDARPSSTHEVDVRPMTDDEIRTEALSPGTRRQDPWLAECSCGARMLPLLPGEANAWEQGHLGTRPEC
jgi:hypothetical protein